ncbi:MAG: hypothetical protein VKL59_02855 [Nostocaceae cyanobacterium]|nr:hypothetical protein [Nostocaceae cyanobacterium]
MIWFLAMAMGDESEAVRLCLRLNSAALPPNLRTRQVASADAIALSLFWSI